jgi:hypothetical protein
MLFAYCIAILDIFITLHTLACKITFAGRLNHRYINVHRASHLLATQSFIATPCNVKFVAE